MSSYYCEHCGAAIIDSPKGYVTGCEHWPMGKYSGWNHVYHEALERGYTNDEAIRAADDYCRRFREAPGDVYDQVNRDYE